jgi:hypothetical protein
VSTPASVVVQMQSRIQEWEAALDDRALFLNCYLLMTNNMLGVIQRQGFKDSPWVDRLLHRFADYYFAALEAYERDPRSAPAVWQRAHDGARSAEMTALQKMLLGINAHINYDLVLSVVDLLQPEWRSLADPQRAARHADYLHVNDVIAHTVDAVQDKVIAPAMAIMHYLDELMGPVDEMVISRLIAHWRDTSWLHAMSLLDAEDGQARAHLTRKVVGEALKTADLISLKAAPKS